MKTKFIALTIVTLFLFACQMDSYESPLDNDSQTTIFDKFGSDGNFNVSVPFKADFSVWNHSDFTDVTCGAPPFFNFTMKGSGNITHLGKMTTIMKFCIDSSTGHYTGVDGIFVAANGDELYFVVPEGWVIPNEGDNSSYYQSRFDNPLYFTGGTGRFKDATGEATTNAFVHELPVEEWRTDFFSQGFLILKKKLK
jgi:hypothetical protein